MSNYRKLLTLVFSLSLFSIGCSYKETIVVDSSSLIEVDVLMMDGLIASQQLVRLTYYQKSGSIKKSVRGYFVSKKDEVYTFQPKKIGETIPEKSIDIKRTDIKKLSIITNDGLRALDFLPIWIVSGIVIVGCIIILTGNFHPGIGIF